MRQFITLPNILTFSRIPLAFVFMFLLFADRVLWALVVLIVAAISDLEGFIARKKGVSSDFGAFFDPFCDKFFMIIAVVGITLYYKLELWQVFMILFREFFVLAYMMSLVFMGYKNTARVVKARIFGKIATTLQFISVFLLMTGNELFTLSVYLTFVFSFLASFDYMLKLKMNFHLLK